MYMPGHFHLQLTRYFSCEDIDFLSLPKSRALLESQSMGFFGNLIGSTDDNVMANGILARGEVLNLQMSGLTLRVNNGLVARKCTISMSVMMDNVTPFTVDVVQRIPEIIIAKLTRGAVIPVRVDPHDHSRVFIDFASEIPIVTMPEATNENSVAYILEHGKPLKVVLIASEPLKLRTPEGIDIYLLTLTVYEGVDKPYQTRMGNPVPATALPLMYPGSKLYAKLGDSGIIAIDWTAGPAEPGAGDAATRPNPAALMKICDFCKSNVVPDENHKCPNCGANI